MQCDFCHEELTEGGYVLLDKQWRVCSHVDAQAASGRTRVCEACSTTLGKKEMIRALMKRHPAHERAVESIIERCKREGYGVTFSKREIDDLLGLEQARHGSREELEDYKSARKQGLDNIKRELLYNHGLRFSGTKKTQNGQSGWCVRPC